MKKMCVVLAFLWSVRIGAAPNEVPELNLAKVSSTVKKQSQQMNSLGMRLYKNRDYEGAIATFRLGLDINPGHILMRYNLACTYSILKDKQKALTLLEQFKEATNCEKCVGRLKRAKEDSDFKWLWKDEDFLRITSLKSASTAFEESKNSRTKDLLGVNTVFVPAGSFTMGSPKSERFRSADEIQHSVLITRAFHIMKSEVTQGFYQNLMQRNPSHFKGCGLDCPVENVSWFDMIELANALSKKQGLEPCYRIEGPKVSWPQGLACTGWRLPTEAEWEYAARGGQNHSYSGSENIDAVGWYKNNSNKKTHPVCQKQKNRYGLCDMSGNVFEWVWDGYAPLSTVSVTDPVGPKSVIARGNRGGSWGFEAGYARVALREGLKPKSSGYDLGGRLVRTAIEDIPPNP